MKNFKKFSMLGIIGICALVLSGCGTKVKNLDYSLEETMTKVYDNIDGDKLPMMLSNTEITQENLEYYTGLISLDFESGIASESRVGSIPHSVVLLKVKDSTDIDQIKKDIKEKVNPNKWICVGIDDQNNVIVNNIGNTIILIMDNEIANDLNNNFETLNK